MNFKKAFDEARKNNAEWVRAGAVICRHFHIKVDMETGELLARGRRSAEERKARLISAAQMEGRKMSLAAKQEVLDEAFRQALEEMCSLPEEQYIQLLARLAVQASSTGREQLIFSPKDRTRIGKAVVMAATV